MTNKKINSWIPILVIPVLGWSTQVYAHGAQIKYRLTSAITVNAIYDDGNPMSNAQVVIYAPDEPTTPWLQGITDDQGGFSFVPDPKKLGNWDVKIRQAGHGDIVSIPWDGGNLSGQTSTASIEGGYTSLQKVVMAAVGVWGFVGTALFFWGKQAKKS
jgi:nickel transport protein